MQYKANRKVNRKVKWSKVVRVIVERVFTQRNVEGMLGLVALIVLVAIVKPDSAESKQVEAKQVEVKQVEAKPAATVTQSEAKPKAMQAQSETLSKATYADYVVVEVKQSKSGKEWYGIAVNGSSVVVTGEQLYGREAKVGDVVRCYLLPRGQGESDMLLFAEVIKQSKSEQ